MGVAVQRSRGGQDTPSAGLDMFGNVYVTGRTSAPGFVFDFATVKYDPDGTRLWEKRSTARRIFMTERRGSASTFGKRLCRRQQHVLQQFRL